MFNAENLKFYFYAQRQPRPQGFSLKKWVGKPWGRGWLKDTVDRFFLWTLTDYERPKKRATYSLKFCRTGPTKIEKEERKEQKRRKREEKVNHLYTLYPYITYLLHSVVFQIDLGTCARTILF